VVEEVGMTIWNFWFENMSGVGISLVRPHLLGGGRIKSFPETVTESSKALFITAIPKRFTRQYKSYEAPV
jgi:hypothetical protein